MIDFMHKILSLTFIFLCTSAFALSEQQLKSKFSNSHTFGSLSLPQLQLLEKALSELDQAHYFIRFKDILQRKDLEETLGVIKTCRLKSNNLGYFNQKKSYVYGTYYFQKIFQEQWSASSMETLADSYHYYIQENPAFPLLVMFHSPEICLKPGLNLAQTLAILVHEFKHFFDADKEIKTYLDFADINSYLEYRLYGPGGEMDAFKEQKLFEQDLKEKTQVTINSQANRFFTYGYLTQREEFESFILDSLGYRQRIENDYENLRKSNIFNGKKDHDHLNYILQIYSKNAEVHEYNIYVFEHNMKMSGYKPNHPQMIEWNKNLNIARAKKEFYQNLTLKTQNELKSRYHHEN